MSTSLDLSKLSLMDALDLAKLIEMEACHRYQMFASQLGRSGGYDAGAFFASMAENEAKHGQELEARRKALFGDAPVRLTLDDLYDVEAPEMGAPRRGMSTLQAFVARHNRCRCPGTVHRASRRGDRARRDAARGNGQTTLER